MAGPRLRLRRPRRTARLRLTALYGGLFLLSGAALVAVTYVLFERATAFTQPQLPRIPATPAIKSLELLPNGGAPTAITAFLPQIGKAAYQLTQAQHRLLNAQAQFDKHPPSPTRLLPQLTKDQRQLTRDQHQLAGVEHQLTAAVHQLARTGSAEAAQRAADSHQLLIDSGIALGVVAVLALAAGWLVAGRMLRPIRTITRTARRISSASLHERLALEGPPDELKELGDTLDDLFDRLEASFEAQRQFVANASHELRTPLARQRALIQVALADPQASIASLRSAHERVLASEQHLEEMINALLTLTRGQTGTERREQLDLAELASEALVAREAELAGRDLDVRATLDAAALTGDPRLIERLIANLIDNAIRHNAPRGHIEIATGTRDRRALLSITNSGAAIAPDDVPRLFQPFQRLSGARTRQSEGLGLGLSIVDAIAAAHGAELTTSARPQGGLTIEIAFPPAGGAGSEAAVAWTRRVSPRAGRLRRLTLRRAGEPPPA
jgi:signal transduction histidine kinase